MINLSIIYSSLESDIKAVSDMCDELYNTTFLEYFKESKDLFKRIKSKSHPVTDKELEWILISLPINLFEVSEIINKFRLSLEVIKLKNKEIEQEKLKTLSNSEYKLSVTQCKEQVSAEMTEYKILVILYTTLITRVESEISFSRELIMSAKKIWDARRRTDNSNPVSEVDTSQKNLQGYNKSYIHGGTN